MKSSMKGGKGKRREGKGKEELPEHTLVLRHRLHDALNLGIKYCADKKRKWQCQDAEIMRHAVRLMSTFCGCISRNTSHHPLIKDTVSDILTALEGILQSEHDAILTPAADVTAKLLLNLGGSIREYEYLDLIFPLSKLLSFRQMDISVSCAIALKCIISNLGLSGECKKSNAVWDVLKKTSAVESILIKLQDCPVDFFIELASLLKEILQRWSESRYSVWNKIELINGQLTLNPDDGSSVLLSVIQLFSALALCADVGVMMLERKRLVSQLLSYSRSSQSAMVRSQAFACLQNLSLSDKGCRLLVDSCAESLMEGVIQAIHGPLSSSNLRRIPNDQMYLAAAAWQVASSVTRLPGAHHAFLWKLRIDHALCSFLLPVDFSKSVITDPLIYRTNTNSSIRIHAWHTLGFLSKHCEDSHLLRREEKVFHIDTLIDYSCLVALDLMVAKPSSKNSHTVLTSESELVLRVVAMMVFSPSNYISTRAKDALFGNVLKFGSSYIVELVDKLGQRCFGNNPNLVVELSRLAFFSSLTQFQDLILERETLGKLISIINHCINGEFDVYRSSMGYPKTCCCFDSENPKLDDLILLYSLQALSQLLPSVDSPLSIDHTLFSTLKHIAGDNCVDQDSRWYASYCLNISFNFYGFPNSLGKKLEGFINGDEFTDLQLMLPNGEILRVHSAVLVARCPALVPWEKLRKVHGEVIHLSNNVDGHALRKLLDYLYTGYCCDIDDDVAKPLSVLAKRCNVNSLHNILKRNLPRCSVPIPRCDFSPLLADDGYRFSDIILEAKEDEGKWNCGSCESPIPHVHAHKIFLMSGSSYMRALFQSGMRESYSQSLKVPISQRALLKLVTWFYMGELPKLEFHCRWNYMSSEEQFLELIIYLELSWLAESWCLDDVHQECTELVVSCIETTPSFPLEIIKSASTFGCHAIVGAAISRLGPLYPQLRDSGELDSLDEALVDLLRSEYVHCSQKD